MTVQNKPKLTLREKLELLEYYEKSRKNVQTIADKVQVSKVTFYNYLKKRGDLLKKFNNEKNTRGKRKRFILCENAVIESEVLNWYAELKNEQGFNGVTRLELKRKILRVAKEYKIEFVTREWVKGFIKKHEILIKLDPKCSENFKKRKDEGLVLSREKFGEQSPSTSDYTNNNYESHDVPNLSEAVPVEDLCSNTVGDSSVQINNKTELLKEKRTTNLVKIIKKKKLKREKFKTKLEEKLKRRHSKKNFIKVAVKSLVKNPFSVNKASKKEKSQSEESEIIKKRGRPKKISISEEHKNAPCEDVTTKSGISNGTIKNLSPSTITVDNKNADHTLKVVVNRGKAKKSVLERTGNDLQKFSINASNPGVHNSLGNLELARPNGTAVKRVSIDQNNSIGNIFTNDEPLGGGIIKKEFIEEDINLEINGDNGNNETADRAVKSNKIKIISNNLITVEKTVRRGRSKGFSNESLGNEEVSCVAQNKETLKNKVLDVTNDLKSGESNNDRTNFDDDQTIVNEALSYGHFDGVADEKLSSVTTFKKSFKKGKSKKVSSGNGLEKVSEINNVTMDNTVKAEESTNLNQDFDLLQTESNSNKIISEKVEFVKNNELLNAKTQNRSRPKRTVQVESVDHVKPINVNLTQNTNTGKSLEEVNRQNTSEKSVVKNKELTFENFENVILESKGKVTTSSVLNVANCLNVVRKPGRPSKMLKSDQSSQISNVIIGNVPVPVKKQERPSKAKKFRYFRKKQLNMAPKNALESTGRNNLNSEAINKLPDSKRCQLIKKIRRISVKNPFASKQNLQMVREKIVALNSDQNASALKTDRSEQLLVANPIKKKARRKRLTEVDKLFIDGFTNTGLENTNNSQLVNIDHNTNNLKNDRSEQFVQKEENLDSLKVANVDLSIGQNETTLELDNSGQLLVEDPAKKKPRKKRLTEIDKLFMDEFRNKLFENKEIFQGENVTSNNTQNVNHLGIDKPEKLLVRRKQIRKIHSPFIGDSNSTNSPVKGLQMENGPSKGTQNAKALEVDKSEQLLLENSVINCSPEKNLQLENGALKIAHNIKPLVADGSSKLLVENPAQKKTRKKRLSEVDKLFISGFKSKQLENVANVTSNIEQNAISLLSSTLETDRSKQCLVENPINKKSRRKRLSELDKLFIDGFRNEQLEKPLNNNLVKNVFAKNRRIHNGAIKDTSMPNTKVKESKNLQETSNAEESSLNIIASSSSIKNAKHVNRINGLNSTSSDPHSQNEDNSFHEVVNLPGLKKIIRKAPVENKKGKFRRNVDKLTNTEKRKTRSSHSEANDKSLLVENSDIFSNNKNKVTKLLKLQHFLEKVRSKKAKNQTVKDSEKQVITHSEKIEEKTTQLKSVSKIKEKNTTEVEWGGFDIYEFTLDDETPVLEEPKKYEVLKPKESCKEKLVDSPKVKKKKIEQKEEPKAEAKVERNNNFRNYMYKTGVRFFNNIYKEDEKSLDCDNELEETYKRKSEENKEKISNGEKSRRKKKGKSKSKVLKGRKDDSAVSEENIIEQTEVVENDNISEHHSNDNLNLDIRDHVDNDAPHEENSCSNYVENVHDVILNGEEMMELYGDSENFDVCNNENTFKEEDDSGDELLYDYDISNDDNGYLGDEEINEEDSNCISNDWEEMDDFDKLKYGIPTSPKISILSDIKIMSGSKNLVGRRNKKKKKDSLLSSSGQQSPRENGASEMDMSWVNLFPDLEENLSADELMEKINDINFDYDPDAFKSVKIEVLGSVGDEELETIDFEADDVPSSQGQPMPPNQMQQSPNQMQGGYRPPMPPNRPPAPRGPQSGGPRMNSGPRGGPVNQRPGMNRPRAPMTRPRAPGVQPVRGQMRPRMAGPQNGIRPGSQQSPVKRTPEQVAALQNKRKKLDVLTPSDKDDDDCQVISMQPKNTDGGLPVIESVQGASDNSIMHLSDSITLSVRNPPPKPVPTPQKSDAKAVANILATRGITVTASAKPKEQQSPSPTKQAPALPTALSLNGAVSIVATKNNGGTVAAKPAESLPTVDLTDDTPSPKSPISPNKNRPGLPYRCDLCPAQYPNSIGLNKHRQTYHKTTSGMCELGVPLINLKTPGIMQKMSTLGINNYIPLPSAGPDGTYALPVISTKQPGNVTALGATQMLSLGPIRAIPRTTGPNVGNAVKK